MYGKGFTTAGLAAGSAGGFAFTGLNLIWLLLAVFAFIAAGLAVKRMIPKKQA
jgi:hypothetical protein